MPVEDGDISVTVRRHGLTIVIGNDEDYRRSGLKVFNPFKDTTMAAPRMPIRYSSIP